MTKYHRILAQRRNDWEAPEPAIPGHVYRFREEWRLRANGVIEWRVGRDNEYDRSDGYPPPEWRLAAHIQRPERVNEATFNRWIDLHLEIRELLKP